MRVSALEDPAGARRALEKTIRDGGVALFPADGLYGLACDPLSPSAIDRIHGIKGRPDGKPSAVMFFSPLIMRELIGDMEERTRSAVAALLPGAVTAVIDNPGHRYRLACGSDRSKLGVRLIEGPLSGVRTPIFQTSANRSGEPAPSGFGGVDPAICEAVDLVIDGGELTGMPSTVIDLSALDRDGSWSVLREGAVSAVEAERRLAGI